jgi:hypothetical protein
VRTAKEDIDEEKRDDAMTAGELRRRAGTGKNGWFRVVGCGFTKGWCEE